MNTEIIFFISSKFIKQFNNKLNIHSKRQTLKNSENQQKKAGSL